MQKTRHNHFIQKLLAWIMIVTVTLTGFSAFNSVFAKQPVPENLTSSFSGKEFNKTIKTIAYLGDQKEKGMYSEEEQIPDFDEFYQDMLIERIEWSDMAPAEGVETTELSADGRLVAWYVSGEKLKEQYLQEANTTFESEEQTEAETESPAEEVIEQETQTTAAEEDATEEISEEAEQVPVTATPVVEPSEEEAEYRALFETEYLNTIYLYFNSERNAEEAEDTIHRVAFPQDMSYAFANMENLKDISALRYISTENVEDMSFLFFNDKALQEVSPVGSFRMGKVVSADSMFEGCTSLKDITEFVEPHKYDLEKDEKEALYRVLYFQLLNRDYDKETAKEKVEEYRAWYEGTEQSLETTSKRTYPDPYDAWKLGKEISIKDIFKDCSLEEKPSWWKEPQEETSAQEPSTEAIEEETQKPEETEAETQPQITDDQKDDAKTTEVVLPQQLSTRIMVVTSEENDLSAEKGFLSVLNNVALFQFDTVEEAKDAYIRFASEGMQVEFDSVLVIADDSNVVDTTDIIMTEDNNPFAQAEEIPAQEKAFDIALIDTGADRATKSVSVVDGDGSDWNGHGNKMLRTIREENPGAKVLSIQAVGPTGIASTSAVYAAIQYARKSDVAIINLSISAYATEENSLIRTAIEEAIDDGIIVVGAAGNDNQDASLFIPGGIDRAIIVGAAEDNGARRDNSNFGATVDYNVSALSTSFASARMSGWLSIAGIDAIEANLNKGIIFETDYEPSENNENDDVDFGSMTEEEILRYLGFDPAHFHIRDLGEEEVAGDFKVAREGHFYAVAGVGDNDVIFYGYVDGNYTTAYCVNHGWADPWGQDYYLDSTKSQVLGYIMRHGYPNTNWGLSWTEAQFITQSAVFAAMGVNLYAIQDGIIAQSTLYGYLFSGNNFYLASQLVNEAWANATSEDAQYVEIWRDPYGGSQGMAILTPETDAYLTIYKASSNITISAGGARYTLAGAQFGVYASEADANADRNRIALLTTDAAGATNKIKLPNADRTYYFREVLAPPGYYLNTNVYSKYCAIGQQSTTIFETPKPKAKVSVIKEDVSNGGRIKEGAQFTLYIWSNASGGWVPVGTLSENRDSKGGRAEGVYSYFRDYIYEDEDNPQGRFLVEETITPAPYKKEATSLVTGELIGWTSGELYIRNAQADLTYPIEGTNKHEEIPVYLTKVVETLPNETISGCVFEIYPIENGVPNESKAYTMVWNDTTQRYEAKVEYNQQNKGHFYVKEVRSQEDLTCRWENPNVILNYSQTSNEPQNIGGGGPVENDELSEKAVVRVRKGKTTANATTDPSHTNAIYTLYEWKNNAYTLNQILKYNEETGYYESSEILRYDNPASTKYNEGKYKIVETRPPSGLTKNNTEMTTLWTKEFIIADKEAEYGSYDSEEWMRVTRSEAGYVQTFQYNVQNQPNSYQILKRIGDSSSPLSGVTFRVTKDGVSTYLTTGDVTNGWQTWEVNGETVFSYRITADTIYLSEIIPGTYSYYEDSTPPNYRPDGKTYSFRVTEDGFITDENETGQEASETVHNWPEREYLIIKTSSAGNPATNADETAGQTIITNFPMGTSFEVYECDGNWNYNTSNIYASIIYNGTAFVDANTGDYPVLKASERNQGQFVVREVSATPGYIMDTTVQRVQVPTRTDEVLPIEVPFENVPNKFIIYKNNPDGQPLGGCSFTFRHADGEQHVITSSDDVTNIGVATIYRLKPGTWTFWESAAQPGYAPDPNVYTLTVNDDGTITFGGNTAAEASTTMINHKETILRVTKQDANTGAYQNSLTEFPVGTEFDVYEWSESQNAWVKISHLKHKSLVTIPESGKTMPKTGKEEDAPLIAVIDTGSAESLDIEGRYSVIDEDGLDVHGHGTTMIGTILEQNPNARIISIKALDEFGFGKAEDIVAALQLAHDLGADIINMSFSAPKSDRNQQVIDAIQAVLDDGIIVVGAAGDSGRNTKDVIPACVEGVIAVAASDTEGKLLPGTNVGDYIDYSTPAAASSQAAAIFSGWLSCHNMEDADFAFAKVYGLTFTEYPTYNEDDTFMVNAGLDFWFNSDSGLSWGPWSGYGSATVTATRTNATTLSLTFSFYADFSDFGGQGELWILNGSYTPPYNVDFNNNPPLDSRATYIGNWWSSAGVDWFYIDGYRGSWTYTTTRTITAAAGSATYTIILGTYHMRIADGRNNNYAHLNVSWGAAMGSIDVNPVIDGTTYATGKAGYTFNVYNGNTLVASNVTDYATTSAAAGDTYRIVANNVTGWTLTNGDTSWTVTSGGSYEFKPTWTETTANLTYNANQGTLPSGFTTPVSMRYTTATTIQSGTPTRSGYTFKGWSTSNTAANATYTAGNTFKAANVVPTATTLYAVWNSTLSYDANSGSGAPGSQNMTYPSAVTVSNTKPTRTGYTFSNWNTASNGSGSSYNSGVQFKATNTWKENTTLYAQWTANNYTVTFNANGGSVSPTTKTVTYDSAYGTLPTPTRTGYIFQGWYTSATGGTQVTNTTTVTTANNHTLFARWTPITYQVKFNANGGSGTMANQTMTYDTTATLTTNAFARNGYSFVGWSTSANGDYVFGDEQAVRNLSATQGAVVDLYAIWQSDTEIIFVDDGSVNATNIGLAPVLQWTEDNQGQFKIVEVKSSPGYIMDGTVDEIVLDEAGNTYTMNGDAQTIDNATRLVNAPFNNTPNKYTIQKRTSTGNYLPGVTFRIWKDGASASDTIATYMNGYQETAFHTNTSLITDANGRIVLDKLSPGTWHYQETAVPAGTTYIIDDTIYTFVVDENGYISNRTSVTNTVYNSNDATFRILKVDENGRALANFRFIINDGTGDTTYTTDSNGYITLTGDALVVGRTYSFREDTTQPNLPTGVIIGDTTTHTATVSANGVSVDGGPSKKVQVWVHTNYINKFRLRKVDSNGNPLEGITFHVWRASREHYLTTGADGYTDYITMLTNGTWYYQEYASTNEGYIMDLTRHSFTVDSTTHQITLNGATANTATATVTNTPNHYRIRKVDASGNAISGVVFNVDVLRDGVMVRNQYTTNGSGIIEFNKVPDGEYIISEASTGQGYIKTNETHIVSVVNGHVSIDNVEVTATSDTLTITNRKNSLEIRKVDSITGALITTPATFSVNGTNYTTINGVVTLSNLNAGTYTVREVTAPTDYDIDNTAHTFTISSNGEVTGIDNDSSITLNANTHVITFTHKNHKTLLGNVKLTKYDINDSNLKLQGVGFGLYEFNSNTNTYSRIRTASTNASGVVTFNDILVTDANQGKFRLVEESGLEGYETPSWTADFTIDEDDRNKDFVVAYDVPNMPVSYTIHKTDEEGDPVTGAAFEIWVPTLANNAVIGYIKQYDETTGELLGKTLVYNHDEVEVDAFGLITLFELRKNVTYYYQETVFPNDYMPFPDDVNPVFSFTVDNNNKVNNSYHADSENVINYTDTPYEGKVIIEKTDDNGNYVPNAVFEVYEWDKNMNDYNNIPIAEINSSCYNTTTHRYEYPNSFPYTALNEGKFKVVETKTDVGLFANWQDTFQILINGEHLQTFSLTATNTTNELSVIKTDDNNNDIPGATFTLKGYVNSADGVEWSSDPEAIAQNDDYVSIYYRVVYESFETENGSAEIQIGHRDLNLRIFETPDVSDMLEDCIIGMHPGDTTSVTIHGPAMGEEEGGRILQNSPKYPGMNVTVYITLNSVDVKYRQSIETTPSDMVAHFQRLAAGQYVLTEEKAPTGYVKSEDRYYFVVNENGTIQQATPDADGFLVPTGQELSRYTFRMENLPNKFVLNKVDGESPTQKLSGVSFLFSATEEYHSDDAQPYGASVVIGYLADGTEIHVGDTITTAEDDGTVTLLRDGETVPTILQTDDEAGTISIHRLIDGTWTYTETDLGIHADDYELPEDPYFFEVKDGIITDIYNPEESGREVSVDEVNFPDNPTPVGVKVEKFEGDTENHLSGVKFVVQEYSKEIAEQYPERDPYVDIKLNETMEFQLIRPREQEEPEILTPEAFEALTGAVAADAKDNDLYLTDDGWVLCVSKYDQMIAIETSPGIYEMDDIQVDYDNLGKFRLIETQSAPGFASDWSREFDYTQRYWEFTGDEAARNYVNHLVISKKDANTLLPLENALIQIDSYDFEDGTVIGYREEEDETGTIQHIDVLCGESFRTDLNGEIHIYGLEAGHTYIVKEIETPSNDYRINPDEYVVVALENGCLTSGAMANDAAQEFELVILNERGLHVDLPMGGAGRAIFFILGFVLLAGLGIGFVLMKKQNK